RIETDLAAVHPLVAGKARIVPRIRHEQHLGAVGLPAGEFAWRLARLKSNLRLDEVPVALCEAHQRDGNGENPLREPRDALERLFGLAVGDVEAIERGKPRLVTLARDCRRHRRARTSCGWQIRGRAERQPTPRGSESATDKRA